jgi:hypothetical protein
MEELPSLEQVEEMDRLRSSYIESLEFDSEQKNNVKCQGCGSLCPVIKQNERNKLEVSEPRRDRIYYLQKLIEQAEKYHLDGIDGCKDEKEEELKSLLDYERQEELLRRLPLYSNRMTGFRFLCSTCYDKIYYKVRIKHEST